MKREYLVYLGEKEMLEIKKRKVKNKKVVKSYYIRWTRALNTISRHNRISASVTLKKYVKNHHSICLNLYIWK